MDVYEVVVNAKVTNTFRVIAENQREAAERANRMFSNDTLAKVLELNFHIHQNEELVG